MPIDSTTDIERLEFGIPLLVAFLLAVVSARVKLVHRFYRILIVPRTANGTYDVNDPEVAEVISRVKAGTIPVIYIINDSYLNQALGLPRFNHVRDDQLPEIYWHLRNEHPFHTTFVAPDKSRGPYIDIFYQRSVATPTAVASTFTEHESIGGFESRVRTEGWLLEPPTGTDTLYWNSVRYGVYADHEPWTSADSVETGDIEWSVDHAATWLTTPPTDYATVTHVRVLQGSDYIGLPVRSDPDPDNPFIELAPHDLISLPTDGVSPREITGAGLRDLYQIGVRMDMYDTSGDIVVSGEGWLSTATKPSVGGDPSYGLQLLPASGFSDTSLPPASPYAYILSMDTDTGEVRIDHSDRGILSADYAGRAACYLTFAGFPVTTLHTAVSAATTSIVVQNSTGMKNGDILFVESEQMRINGQVFGSTIDVTRGVNGTTAAAHISGVTIRGTVTQDMLHLVHLWEVDNTIPLRCRASIVGLKRAGR